MRIAIAVDGSDHAERAFDSYVRCWHRKGNEVFLLHALHLSVNGALHDTSPAVLAHTCEAIVNEAHSLQAKYEKKLADNGIEGKWFTIQQESNLGESIVHAASERDLDLIVIGSRGRGTIRRTLLGSVSDYILKHAVCPVVVCPPDKHHGGKHHKHDKHDGNHDKQHTSHKEHSYEKPVINEDHIEQTL